MNIILLKRKRGSSSLVTLNKNKIALVAVFAMFVLPATFLFTGYKIGVHYMKANPDDLMVAMESEMDVQRLKIDEVTKNAEENMNALALRLGKLQAHVIRIDALGSRLASMAKLDNGEFDFSQSPAQGGPVSANDNSTEMQVPDFMKSLKELSAQLDNRNEQLNVLETMMMNRNLQAEVMPAGRPIKRGWLSSYFGIRTDPFTGRLAHHSGIDFAGKMGSDVVAVAAGVVTYAAKRSGYGRLVQINHGNGYSTRYGHNSQLLVKVGDTVKKGQVISKMGTSGRSTGPHVHFEVLYHGHAVNPKKYITASR